MTSQDLKDNVIGSLVPYYMQNNEEHPVDPNNPKAEEYFCFNDITKFGDLAQITQQSSRFDPFKINANGKIPSE
jgi:hypothetical protein